MFDPQSDAQLRGVNGSKCKKLHLFQGMNGHKVTNKARHNDNEGKCKLNAWQTPYEHKLESIHNNNMGYKLRNWTQARNKQGTHTKR